jgi:hypothetical protein
MTNYRKDDILLLDAVALVDTRPDAKPQGRYVNAVVLSDPPSNWMTWVAPDGGSPLWVWNQFLRRW